MRGFIKRWNKTIFAIVFARQTGALFAQHLAPRGQHRLDIARHLTSHLGGGKLVLEHFDQRAALPALGCGGFGGVVVMVAALAFVVVESLLYGKAHLVAVVVMGQTFEHTYRRQGKRHKEYGQQLFHSRCKDTNFTAYCQYLFVGIFCNPSPARIMPTLARRN